MTLMLSRVDYTTVGVTARGTTKILPPTEPRQTQKFAVGDFDGVLQVFGMKKGELQLSYKSLPGPKISKIALGGTLGEACDKIFIAYDNSVRGFTKKGKLFLEFDTSLIDPISLIYVLGADLVACARDLYHRYRDCKDADSYLAGETIHDVVLLPSDGSSVLAILACRDSAVRVLHGTKTPTVLRLPSTPTVLAVFRDGTVESKDKVMVGTNDGKIGLLTLQGNKTLRITWLIDTAGSEVTSLDTYELQDGIDILVGRQDGTVEVFIFPEEEISPALRYRYNAGESISSVNGGIVGAQGYPEVLVTTYSGQIFGLTTRPPGLLEAEQNVTGVARLMAEIQQLEEKLLEEKEIIDFTSDPLTPRILSVNHRMVFLKEEAAYLLTVELDTPIDIVLVQSDTPVELMDVESNDATFSVSFVNEDETEEEGNVVLATYKCQENANRVDIKLRTIEGQSGSLQVYVTSQIQPKHCRRIVIPICTLSLHVRQYDDDEIASCAGPFNELRFNGGFTIAEMHAWLSLALPDVPERPQAHEGEATLRYVSAFVGTALKCTYRKGSATFFGESISTIMYLRDVLTKEATKRKIRMDVFCDTSEGSIMKVLELVLPRLESARDSMKKLKILNALEEWELNVNPKENLCTEYQKLLNDEAMARSKVGKDGEILNRLNAVIIDLYVEWECAKGSRRIDSKTAEERLQPALDSRDINLLLKIFTGKDDASISVPQSVQNDSLQYK